MTDQFMRTRLLLGDKALMRLQKAHVAVVGCGAVGSFAAEALARAGVGRLTLIDHDKVELSNINRQLFALHSTLDEEKVAVAEKRLKDINPALQITTYPVFATSATFATLFADKPDFVIDAIDTLTAKADLILYLLKEGIPFASSMGAALKVNPARVQETSFPKTSGCPVAARLRKLLRAHLGTLPDFPVVYSDEPPQKATAGQRQMGSLITLTGLFGLRLAHIALSFLTRESVESPRNLK